MKDRRGASEAPLCGVCTTIKALMLSVGDPESECPRASSQGGDARRSSHPSGEQSYLSSASGREEEHCPTDNDAQRKKMSALK